MFDEGHKFKNPDTKVYKTFVRLRPNWRILLTGTPVQNNLMELVSLIRFLDPKHIEKYLADLEVIFSHRASLKEVSNGVILFGERIKRARAILAPFILQRSKAQVLKNFPPKVYRLVRCEMDEAQQRIYQSFQDKFKSTTGRRSGRGNDENNTWVQLRKSAIHSQLFRRFFTDEKVEKMAQILMANIDQSELRQPNLGHLIQELKDLSDFELHLWCRDYPRLLGKFDVPDGSWMKSGKVQELLKLLDEFRQNGDRVLVFSRFAKVIEILTECLSTAGHEHLVLKGETDVSERQDLINEFNNNPDITAFLLTTGAGGTGINLAAANKVIIFDQSDNPQDDIQAENRAHRLGQKREVEVIRLVSKGTIEEMVYLACRKKVALANQVVSNGDEEKNQAQESLEQEIRKMMAENEKAGRAALAADLDGDAELRETAVAVAASTSGATTASAADSGDVKKEIGLPSPGRGSETSVEREVIEIGSSRSTSVVSSSPSRH